MDRAFNVDPYACGSLPPRPGRLCNPRYDAGTRQHTLSLPPCPPGVKRRAVFFEVRGQGTSTVQVRPGLDTVSIALPPNASVVAFVMHYGPHGEAVAGPLSAFRATTKAPPRPKRPKVNRTEERTPA